MNPADWERDTKFFRELEDVLDKYFPKVEEEGPEKKAMKRGEALMLFTEANLIHSKRLAEEIQLAEERGQQGGFKEGENQQAKVTKILVEQSESLGAEKERERLRDWIKNNTVISDMIHKTVLQSFFFFQAEDKLSHCVFCHYDVDSTTHACAPTSLKEKNPKCKDGCIALNKPV